MIALSRNSQRRRLAVLTHFALLAIGIAGGIAISFATKKPAIGANKATYSVFLIESMSPIANFDDPITVLSNDLNRFAMRGEGWMGYGAFQFESSEGSIVGSTGARLTENRTQLRLKTLKLDIAEKRLSPNRIRAHLVVNWDESRTEHPFEITKNKYRIIKLKNSGQSEQGHVYAILRAIAEPPK